MFQPVKDADFISGEHQILKFWEEQQIFDKLRAKNRGAKRWSFLDGPITANNPMGVHHAWGRTYKDAYQRFFAMTGHELRYQNGFDCQGLWVEVEVEKQLGLGTKKAVAEYGIDKFVNECKRRVLKFAARQTEQSQRLGYWMEWDRPDELRKLSAAVGSDEPVEFTLPNGETVNDVAHRIVEKLGNPEWGGSYFTFSTNNNETIWTFLKKCFERGKIYQGHDVMPWSGRGGSAYSQMEIAEGRKLTTHKSVFVRFPLRDRENEFILVWTTTPWTLTSNIIAAVNPDLDYVQIKAKKDGAIYYFAKENLNFQRLASEFKDGFGRPEWKWPKDVPKLKTLAQIFKEQGGFEELGTIKGAEMVGWTYDGPFDDLPAQHRPGGTDVSDVELREREAKLQERAARGADHDDQFATRFRGMHQPRGKTPDEIWFGRLNMIVRDAARAGVVPPSARLQNSQGLSDALLQFALTKTRDYWLSLNFPDDWLSSESEFDIAKVDSDLRSLIYEDLMSVVQCTGIQAHRVIDGGRDARGNAHVVAGEGTGIVHMAPGCGDIDHKIGAGIGIPIIAPLGENGRYIEGFGEFTGKEASDPETAELVFEKLREKGLLVAVETYPHIYPHCWRTGDELVFRLVDEWFINMDWRDEIKDVTREINWLPESIDGQNREVEWLTNMGDWMVSKKRFWGLALPIWVNEEDPTDFEVMGSLDELKERAVEGWDGFEGNSPHRPWIDGVIIESQKNPGQKMRRIEDVGNPWLDAGIVPFSTMSYNENKEEWQKWYPADLVTECFPGQFRNWFYSMLSLGTMMRYDETDDPVERRPFKTLLGHRLVADEEGKPMHKSDGTAIWFEEAAEQLGVDTLRWMYLAQNPAVDLKFGRRHPDEPVALSTPVGEISETKEGFPTCKVTSTPADEIRRQVLIPFWNCYKFFVDYAIADEFDGSADVIPVADRPEIDRWVLSNLQSLCETGNREMAAFNAPGFCKAAAQFIDDLSNWYIRRNRRRFWRSKDASDTDKNAAYQTLHEVLLTLCKLLAPCMPFLTDRMYQNLAGISSLSPSGESRAIRPGEGDGPGDEPSPERSSDPPASGMVTSVPESVHLCDYPQPNPALLDEDLNVRMAAAQRVVRLGHRLREEHALRVRQPLQKLQLAITDVFQKTITKPIRDHVDNVIAKPIRDRVHNTVTKPIQDASDLFSARLKAVIQEELNVKLLDLLPNLDDLVSYTYKPNLKTLGPKYGKLLGVLRVKLPELGDDVLGPLRRGESLTIDIDGNSIDLTPDDVLVGTEQATGWACADESGLQIALSTELDDDLIKEGMARDFVRHVQQLRKDADLQITDRITISYSADSDSVRDCVATWGDYICAETLADSITDSSEGPADTKSVSVGEEKVQIWISTT